MKASEFDIWIKEQGEITKEKKESPVALEVALLTRLEKEHYTYDSTIINIINAWRNYEVTNVNEPGQRAFTNTMKLINLLLSYVDENIFLKGKLQSLKGSLFLENNKLQTAVECFWNAVNHLHAFHLEVDLNRIDNMVIMGKTLLRMNNTENAEKLFLDVLSYPWYLVEESAIRITFREYYIASAIGLIECRKGNLAALKNIFFVPATQQELMPILERAKKEAEFNKTSDPR